MIPQGVSPSVAPRLTATAAATPPDWPTYHANGARTGVASGFPNLSRGLGQAWAATLDGAVYGEPLGVSGRVIVATENDSVYALDPASGHVLWRRHLGTPVPLTSLPCGDIDPLGITSTPVYDPGSQIALRGGRGQRTAPRALRARPGDRRGALVAGR